MKVRAFGHTKRKSEGGGQSFRCRRAGETGVSRFGIIYFGARPQVSVCPGPCKDARVSQQPVRTWRGAPANGSVRATGAASQADGRLAQRRGAERREASQPPREVIRWAVSTVGEE